MKRKIKELSKKLYQVSIPTLTPRTGTLDPQEVVRKAINYALFFVGAVALIFVIYGGIMYITSGGDAEKTARARNTLLYAILGIIIVVLSYLIVQWAAGPGTTELL